MQFISILEWIRVVYYYYSAGYRVLTIITTPSLYNIYIIIVVLIIIISKSFLNSYLSYLNLSRLFRVL